MDYGVGGDVVSVCIEVYWYEKEIVFENFCRCVEYCELE